MEQAPARHEIDATVRVIASAENPYEVGYDDNITAGLNWLLARNRLPAVLQDDMPRLRLENMTTGEDVPLTDLMSQHRNRWMTLYVGRNVRAEIKFDFADAI